MSELDKKITNHFEGKVVRKDLTKLIKGNAVVPSYVLEYLLGQHCATDDDEIIAHGVEKVKTILAKNFVHRDQAKKIESDIKDYGAVSIIDKMSVRLNDRMDRYEADFANLGLKKIPISDEIVKQHKKLLSSGVWSIIKVDYVHSDDKNSRPWLIESLKPIQISSANVDEYKELRKYFTTEEWIDLLLQTMGLNPEEFTSRSKLIQLVRLVPFVENNYNLIELGPKGTGKSHIYSELSPHGILISGGEVSKAKLFVNNSTGEIGLVGYWDVVAYDEFAGRNKKTDLGLVDIMKNYMANKSFSRGTEVYGATASMVFIGNTDNTVSHMLHHSNLFEALPKSYYDTAFLDRIHAYVPGWEVDKLRNEMFSEGYGFVVDYLAEVLKSLRNEDRTNEYSKYFELSDSITTRDKTSIMKTFAGLLKIIYPSGEASLDELSRLFEFSIECRRRVKLQLQKMDETFEDVDFSYRRKGESRFKEIMTLEEIQYLGKQNLFSEHEDYTTPLDKETSEHVHSLAARHLSVVDNQLGVSYKKLFGDYFKGARQIQIVDPYVRLGYQIRNFMELVSLIASYKSPENEVSIKLITSNTEEYMEDTRNKFEEISDNLMRIGIQFNYEFAEPDTIHDRYIMIDDNWKITLGRGLDIWQKTNGYFDIAEVNQLYRQSKSFSITILGKGEF